MNSQAQNHPLITGRWWPLLLLLTGLLLGAGACQQKPDPAQAAAADQVAYYTCPMHPQIHADEPGSCPICKMDLEAVKKPAAQETALTAVFTCPMHPQVRQAEPGSCPICKMDLVKAASQPAPKNQPATNDLVLTAQQLELGNIRVQLLTAGLASTPTTMNAETAPAASQSVLTGTVTANAGRTESISSRVAGRLDKLFVRQTGQVLRKGEPLFAVYSEQLQTLQREYLLALAQARESDAPTYRRFAEATAQKLRLLGVSSAQLRALVRRGQPNPLVTYYSPRTGTVQTLSVMQGQYVAEGSPVLTLTDLSSVWVEAQVYPTEARRLRLGQRVSVRVQGQPEPLPGKVVFLSPELSGESQVTLARIEVANPGGRLQPGAQANVLLPATGAAAPSTTTAPAAAPALSVSPAAIIHDGGASYVWTRTGERQFRRVRVRLGEGTAAAVPVLAGLQANDAVVISGAYLLESEFTLRQGAGDAAMGGMVM